jgi:hypothetical protein
VPAEESAAGAAAAGGFAAAWLALSGDAFFSEAQAVNDINDSVTAKNDAVAVRKSEFMTHSFRST